MIIVPAQRFCLAAFALCRAWIPCCPIPMPPWKESFNGFSHSSVERHEESL